MDFTLDTFKDAVIRWAERRHHTFQYNWAVKGGWEGWVQVDLVAYILSQNSTYDILREQSVFTNNSKKTDLLLNAESDFADQIPVEIKAQSFYNKDKFLPGVESDLHKLTLERSANYQNSDCVMLGIAFGREALEGMLSIVENGQPIFEEIYGDTEVAICMATWTSTRGWADPNVNNSIAIPKVTT